MQCYFNYTLPPTSHHISLFLVSSHSSHQLAPCFSHTPQQHMFRSSDSLSDVGLAPCPTQRPIMIVQHHSAWIFRDVPSSPQAIYAPVTLLLTSFVLSFWRCAILPPGYVSNYFPFVNKTFDLGFRRCALLPLGYVGTCCTSLNNVRLGFQRCALFPLGYVGNCCTSLSSVWLGFSEMCPPPPGYVDTFFQSVSTIVQLHFLEMCPPPSGLCRNLLHQHQHPTSFGLGFWRHALLPLSYVGTCYQHHLSTIATWVFGDVPSYLRLCRHLLPICSQRPASVFGDVPSSPEAM